MLTLPTGLFSGDYSSALRECWPLKFLHTLQPLRCISSRTWGAGRPHVGLCPIFLVRPPGTLVPKAFCFSRDVFLIRHRISELRRPINVKFCHMISICINFIMHVQKFRGRSPKKFGGSKTCKIWHDFTQLPNLIANISATTQDIQNRKATWSRPIPPTLTKQVRWTLVHYPECLECEFGPTQIDFLDRLYFGP